MKLGKKLFGALVAGIIFFLAEMLILLSFSYILALTKGLKYDFHVALHEGIRFGLYVGAVVAVLAFIGTPRRSPPS